MVKEVAVKEKIRSAVRFAWLVLRLLGVAVVGVGATVLVAYVYQRVFNPLDEWMKWLAAFMIFCAPAVLLAILAQTVQRTSWKRRLSEIGLWSGFAAIMTIVLIVFPSTMMQSPFISVPEKRFIGLMFLWMVWLTQVFVNAIPPLGHSPDTRAKRTKPLTARRATKVARSLVFKMYNEDMRNPNFFEEKKLWRKGYRAIVGLDEAGRGPLAGPVVAGAVVVKNHRLLDKVFKKVRDSKKLSARQREHFYKIILADKNIVWGRGVVSAKTIDRINILEATKLAMAKAIENLENKGTKTDFLILDGKMKLDLPLPQKSVVKGDEKVLSCALASIIAKVSRDRLMEKYHQKYPAYGLDKHKGYGSPLHFRRLKKHGACPIHRRTFYPVSAIVKKA